MDQTKRKITKIARDVSRFTLRTLKQDDIGFAEFDFIHVVRHNPGITQAKVRDILSLDKGACARRALSLEHKGYLIRRTNPNDGRSQLLYATEKAKSLKLSKVSVESMAYEWLLKPLSASEKKEFVRMLDIIYQRSKEESIAGFPHLNELVKKESQKK